MIYFDIGDEEMKIVFFQNAAGEAVVLEWIHEQEDKVQAKIFRDLKLLEQYGLSEKNSKNSDQ